MIGALFTGITGLSSQQKALDNEANNIANVNTVGFKSSRISFADQFYQDRIGKGSKVLDAEKLYTQGNLKITGVSYDMALSGEGFFTVKDSNTNEDMFTRAGNFRMGDNGTLQDAAGNEVQGWMMVDIDAQKDVISTNPNVDVFTNDYNKLLASKIVKHSNYVETITAKATDYTSTAVSDSESVFSGAGLKTKSAKISDIEEAIKDYTTWLQRLSEEPDGSSATSTSQISEINFKTGNDGLVTKEGDQVYVFIDGNKISQNFIPTTADDAFITSLLDTSTDTGNSAVTVATNDLQNDITAADNTRYNLTINGVDVYYDSDSNATVQEILDGLQLAVEKSSLTPQPTFAQTDNNDGTGQIVFSFGSAPTGSTTTNASIATENYDVAASRIATYKALSDKISEIPGLQASMAREVDDGNGTFDAFDEADTYLASTYNKDMYYGIMQIKSLIPGQEFIISEVAEVSGNSVVQGNYQTSTAAQAGSGIGALNSSSEALSRLITGNQRDVYTASDLGLDSGSQDFTYGITIYDNELGANIPVPNDGGVPLQQVNIFIDGATSIDDIVNAINNPATDTNNPDGSVSGVENILPNYIVAKNINGNLVIETKDDNYDVEFSGVMKQADNPATDTAGSTLTAAYTPLDVNNNFSGRAGAGAEFIQLVTKVDQTASKGSLQLRLDTLGISDSAFGEFSVDSSGLITMKQDGADFAIGQVAIAVFNNNRGLDPAGDNLLSKTTESGEAFYNLNNDKTAKIEGKTLELSSADLSESLVNLMVFQRAFEANAKSITTSDELLNTLINLKR